MAHRQHRQGGRLPVLDHRASATPWAPARPVSPPRCPATAPTTTRRDRAELAAIWGIADDELPAERGRAYPDIINAVMTGRSRRLWIIGTNPVVSYPNREVLEHALRRLDLLVVQDGFDTPTTELADVVLPAAIWGEKDGTFTNSERRVSRVRAAVAPPGEARSDFDIFLALAERLGLRDRLFPGGPRPADAFEEWRRVSAGRLCDYSGITYDRIDAAGGVQWPCPPGGDIPLAGTPRLYADGRFPTASGQGAAPLRRPRGAVARQAPTRVPAAAQHGPHGRALAHPHQDRPGGPPRAAGPRGVGGDQPGRRRTAAASGPATSVRVSSQPGLASSG